MGKIAAAEERMSRIAAGVGRKADDRRRLLFRRKTTPYYLIFQYSIEISPMQCNAAVHEILHEMGCAVPLGGHSRRCLNIT